MSRFESGRCLNCGQEIKPGKLFCDKPECNADLVCDISPLEFKKIKDMKNGEIGYIDQDSVLFVIKGDLFVDGDHLLYNRPTDYHKTKIRKIGRRLEIEEDTLDLHKLLSGYPDPMPVAILPCEIY